MISASCIVFFTIFSKVLANWTVSDDLGNGLLHSKLINDIITNYFFEDKCVVILSDGGIPIETTQVNWNLTFIFISTDDLCQDSRVVENIVFAIDNCCYSYILLVANPKCGLQAWGEAQHSLEFSTIQRLSPKLFVVIEESNRSSEMMNDFLSVPEAELSSKIVVAVTRFNSADWQASLYTNNFYERIDKPGRKTALFLDRWNDIGGFDTGVNLYADKMVDMRGKDLYAQVVDLLPYSEYERFVGMEPEIINVFCSRHNCTIKKKTDDYCWGEVFDNGTGNGLLGMINDGRADIGVGGVYLWGSYFQHTQFSSCYLQGGVTLLVPKPQIIGGWLIPFLPFSPSLWVAYILSVGATGASMYFITKATIKYTRFADEVKRRGMFVTPVDTIFRSLGLSVLQQPSTPLVPHTPIRHLFTSFEILYLVLCTIYAAELASYLTAPQYSKPIDSLQELAASGMIWLAEHSGWVYSLVGVDTPTIQTIVSRFKVVAPEKLKELAVSGKYALIVERLAGGHFSKRDYLADNIVAQSHLMEEYLYHSPITAILRKASPYTKHFNTLIGKLLDNGLLLYWEAEASRLYLSSRTQTALEGARKIVAEEEARTLTLSDCLGMFLLYLGGIFVSIVIFCVELTVIKKTDKDSNGEALSLATE